MLPKIKSDLDHLERLAADFHSDGHAQTAIDLRRAVMDIQNLRDALTEEWSQYYENFKRDSSRNVN